MLTFPSFGTGCLNRGLYQQITPVSQVLSCS